MEPDPSFRSPFPLSPAKSDNGPTHVLIVDDDQDQTDMLSGILEASGYRTVVAATGAQALEALARQPVTAALLDIRLPDMEGTDLLQMIRRQAPEIVCIMTTGNKSAEVAATAINLGAKSYFLKPIEPVELLKALGDIVERQRMLEGIQYLVGWQSRLLNLSRTITSTLDLDEVLLTVRNAVCEALGYDRCGIFLVDPDDGQIVGRWGTDRQGRPVDISATTVSLQDDTPIAQVARGEIPYFLTDDWEAYAESTVGRQSYADFEGVHAHALLPLNARGRTVGVLSVDNLISDKPISEADIQELWPFALHAAIAIDNARLYRSAQEHLRRASERAAELELLWQVAQAISSELSVDAVMETVADWVCGALRTRFFSLMLFDSGRRSLEVSTLRGLDRGHALHALAAEGRGAVGAAIRTGDMRVVGDLQASRDPAIREAARAEGLGSMLCVPLRIGEDVMGVMSVYDRQRYRFSSDDQRLLSTLASMASSAIRNAQAFGRERRIAHAMQHELLTQPPDRIGRFRIGSLYRPALEESQVGGDFYDVVELPDGRVALLLADVSGKGLKAAVYTAMGKYMFRALLVEDPSPGRLMERLNAAMCRYTEPGLFITLFYALLDPATGELCYANAGHESPIHYIADHDLPITLDTTGVVLGVDPDAIYIERWVQMKPDDVLLLYTDGVTDARSGDRMLGFEGLQDLLVETLKGPRRSDLPSSRRGLAVATEEDPLPESSSPDGIVESIYWEVHRYASGVLQDDIALLSLNYEDSGEERECGA